MPYLSVPPVKWLINRHPFRSFLLLLSWEAGTNYLAFRNFSSLHLTNTLNFGFPEYGEEGKFVEIPVIDFLWLLDGSCFLYISSSSLYYSVPSVHIKGKTFSDSLLTPFFTPSLPTAISKWIMLTLPFHQSIQYNDFLILTSFILLLLIFLPPFPHYSSLRGVKAAVGTGKVVAEDKEDGGERGGTRDSA